MLICFSAQFILSFGSILTSCLSSSKIYSALTEFKKAVFKCSAKPLYNDDGRIYQLEFIQIELNDDD